MKISRRTKYVLVGFILFIGGTVLYGMFQSTTEKLLDNQLTQDENSDHSEPLIGAAYFSKPSIVESEIQTSALKFGALVGGVADRFIELSPSGDVFASGEITGQYQPSFIGKENLARISSNPRFQIQPGRLSFDVLDMKEHGKVHVRFGPVGELGIGSTLSNLKINVGPQTDSGFLQIQPSGVDMVSFQATRDLHRARIDLAVGGRLTLTSNVGKEVDELLPVNISLESPAPTALVTLYEHIVTDGRYPGGTWSLSRENYWYSGSEVTRIVGHPNIISAFNVAAGYRLYACYKKFYRWKCNVFRNFVGDLRHYGFNDKTLWLHIKRD